MIRRSALAATAHHEAGHAVAAWRLRLKVWRVTITPGEGHAAFAEHDSPLRGVWLDVDGSDRARLKAEKAIMVYLAGTIAQRRFAPRSVRPWHGERDCTAAANLALRFSGSDEMASAFLHWLGLRTADLIEGAWDSVEALAVDLMEHGMLDGAAVLAAMERPAAQRRTARRTLGAGSSLRKAGSGDDAWPPNGGG